MTERDGVRTGMRVRGVDGHDLGRVARLYEWGFAAQKGFPILFRQDHVIRYDEVRGVRDGEVVVARGDRDLLELAAGLVPASWRVPTPHGFPDAATPSEARGLYEVVASWPVTRGAPEVTPDEGHRDEGHRDESRGRTTRGESLLWQREDAERHD